MRNRASVGLLIENTDQRSQNYDAIKDLFRPGHADYAYEQKYGLRDYRSGGRSSARETTMRVAAEAIAKKYPAAKLGTVIRDCLTQVDDIPLAIKDWDQIEQNPFFYPDLDKINALDGLIRDLKKEGDSIGTKVTMVAGSVPSGLGEPVLDHLDADIAHALMSINAMKGVEIGDSFEVVKLCGSEDRDKIIKDGFQSNHAGGILGGTSSGRQIVANIAPKPTSSIVVLSHTISRFDKEVGMITKGRHDPCVGIRAIPIVEAVLAIVLMDHFIRQCAQNGDATTVAPRW